MSFKMYEFLNSLAFTRVSSTVEELKAANMIRRVIEDNGGLADIEEFPVNNFSIEKASLRSETKEYPVTGIMGSGSIEELEAPLYYLENIEAFNPYLVKNHIVLVNGVITFDIYKKLIENKAVAFISFTGDITEDPSFDVAHKELRGPLANLGVIPGVNMHVNTAIELIKDHPQMLKLSLEQKTLFETSRNIISTIKGSKHPNEVITITAHYDSVEYSKGAYDNGAGTAIILKLYEYFCEHTPERTLRFIWCGSEERGLLGSKAFVESLSDEELQQIIFNINIDVAAPVLGTNSAVVTGPIDLKNYVEMDAKIKGYNLVVRQDIYSSDSVPFADKGIPAINFMRFGPKGAAHIHDRYDTMEFLSEESLNDTYKIVENFAEEIVNAKVFPIKKEIPDNIKDKIDHYLFRKRD